MQVSLKRVLPDGATEDLGCYHGGRCMGNDACVGTTPSSLAVSPIP
eukprot:COSAG05_NODE_23812_length_255_cov_0.993590_1_plen_45_part_01